MGFVLNARWQRSAAFGYLNVPNHVVLNDVKLCLGRCKAQALKWYEPTIRGKSFPLDRLRRQMAHALRLDTIFSKKMEITVGENGKQYWGRTPVWKVANRVHYVKSLRVSSLLHEIVAHGWKTANIAHDLVRLSVQIWTLSLKDFTGLCRKILSKIVKALRAYRSSPDPLARVLTLTNNPILTNRVNRHEPVKRRGGDLSRPRPKCLDLLAVWLNKRLRRTERSSRCLRNTT